MRGALNGTGGPISVRDLAVGNVDARRGAQPFELAEQEAQRVEGVAAGNGDEVGAVVDVDGVGLVVWETVVERAVAGDDGGDDLA